MFISQSVLPTLVEIFKTPVKPPESNAEGLPDAVKQPFQQNVPKWGTLNISQENCVINPGKRAYNIKYGKSSGAAGGLVG